MAEHGLIQTTKCDSVETLVNLQKVLRAQKCDGYLVSNSWTSQILTVQKKHLELDTVKCGADRRAIGGHCVSCGNLCLDCLFPNTDGLVHGFFLDGKDTQGTCQACASNSSLSNSGLKNVCSCEDTFYYDQTTDSCLSCSNNCAKCGSFEQCDKCIDQFVVDSGGSCRYINCPEGSFLDKLSKKCVSCHDSCEICSSDGSKCLICPAGHQLGDTICLQCGERETIEGDDCVKCGDSCSECSQKDVCTKCSIGATLLDNKCSCNDGFFLDDIFSTCKSCDESCATCDDAIKCETCPAGFELGLTKCHQCAKDQYLKAGTDECVKCGLNCSQCSNGPNQCMSCAAGSVLGAAGKCECEAARYFDDDIGACVQCHGSCETCQGPDKCETCPTGAILGDSICLTCASNHYIVNDECQQCGPACLSCNANGPRNYQCLQCAVHSGLRLDSNCECLTGFFYDAATNQCDSCDQSCSTCSDSNSCLTCQLGYVRGASGLCECAAGTFFYQTTTVSSQSCQSCDSSCKTCTQADRCLTCPAGSTLGNALCLACKPNEYTTQSDTCSSCGFQCDRCDAGHNQCTQCAGSADLEFGACFCKQGSFRDLKANSLYGECTQCNQSCLSCKDDTHCSECRPGYTLGTSLCLKCEANKYMSGDMCVECGRDCLTCDDGPNKCKQCAPSTVLTAQGTCECEDGRYFDELIQACIKCHSSCKTCLGTDKCATCPDGQQLGETICINCQSNEFVSGDQCETCGAYCFHCDTENSCKVCLPEYDLQSDGSCHKQEDTESNTIECASNEFVAKGVCEKCSPDCIRCFNTDSCLQCDKLTATLHHSGKCDCKDGFFSDITTGGKCKVCDGDCMTCKEQGSCTSCRAPAVLGGKRCLECSSSAFIQDNSCIACSSRFPLCTECQKSSTFGELTCTKCQDGLSLDQATGKCTCSDKDAQYFDELQGKCNQCPENCSSCTSSTQCTACKSVLERVGVDGNCEAKICSIRETFLDTASGECINCDSNCATCKSSATKCTSCANPMKQIIAFDDTCVTCSLGVEPTNSNACLCSLGHYFDPIGKSCSKCKTESCLACEANGVDCLSCKSRYELDSATKACTCPELGFFENAAKSQCQACSTGCQSCMKSSGECISCSPGFFQQQDSCIACLRGCSDCSDIDTCTKCTNSFQLSQDGVCRCPRGKFFESVVNACVPCTLQNCDHCFDRISCIDCQQGYESVLNGQVCKKKASTDDIDEFADEGSNSNDETSTVTTVDPTDEKILMYKTLAISVSAIVVILILLATCFLCYYRQRNKWRKRVDVQVKSQCITYEEGPSYMDQEELQLKTDEEPLQSMWGKTNSTQRTHGRMATIAENPLLSTLSNREDQRIPPLPMLQASPLQITVHSNEYPQEEEAKQINQASLTSKPEQSLEIGTEIMQNSRGSAVGQSRFESSPGHGSTTSEYNSKELNKSKNLIDIAMTIMGDCEIEMTAEARDEMNKLQGEPTISGQTVVLEKIIMILARTVKDQVEKAQQTAHAVREEGYDDLPVGPNKTRTLMRVKSASAQKNLSRLFGTPFTGTHRSLMMFNQDQIEQNIAERFDEMSRGGNGIPEVEEGAISRPNLLISSMQSINCLNEGENCQVREKIEPLGIMEQLNNLDKGSSVSSGFHDRQEIAISKSINKTPCQGTNKAQRNCQNKSQASSSAFNLNNISTNRGRESMPASTLNPLRGTILASINDSTIKKSMLIQSASVKSIKLKDPDIDEDTYQVFVNKDDDAISTKKALNSRLTKFSQQNAPPDIIESIAKLSEDLNDPKTISISDFGTANFARSSIFNGKNNDDHTKKSNNPVLPKADEYGLNTEEQYGGQEDQISRVINQENSKEDALMTNNQFQNTLCQVQTLTGNSDTSIIKSGFAKAVKYVKVQKEATDLAEVLAKQPEPQHQTINNEIESSITSGGAILADKNPYFRFLLKESWPSIPSKFSEAESSPQNTKNDEQSNNPKRQRGKKKQLGMAKDKTRKTSLAKHDLSSLKQSKPRTNNNSQNSRATNGGARSLSNGNPSKEIARFTRNGSVQQSTQLPCDIIQTIDLANTRGEMKEDLNKQRLPRNVRQKTAQDIPYTGNNRQRYDAPIKMVGKPSYMNSTDSQPTTAAQKSISTTVDGISPAMGSIRRNKEMMQSAETGKELNKKMPPKIKEQLFINDDLRSIKPAAAKSKKKKKSKNK